ncbi:MAG: hypothetical protein ACPG3U_07665 [Rhodothermales bacterium]
MYPRRIYRRLVPYALHCAALGVVLSGMLSGCSLAPQALEADRLAPPPARFDSTAVALTNAIDEAAEAVPDQGLQNEDESRIIVHPVAWWTSFEDPALDRLVDSVLVGNLDLHVAEARLWEVQQRYRIARAEQFPVVYRNMEASRQSIPSNTGSTVSNPPIPSAASIPN